LLKKITLDTSLAYREKNISTHLYGNYKMAASFQKI